jgi:hypothetical protein
MAESKFSEELERLRATYAKGLRSQFKEIVAQAGAAWATFDPDDEYTHAELSRLAEICRQTAIACVSADSGNPALWRNRSIALFSRGQSTNGIALLMIPGAMSAIRERDLEAALGHLELMAMLVDESDDVIDGEMVRSAMFENTGIVRIDQEEWELAREALGSALSIETKREDFRRVRKVRGSLATVDYRNASGDLDKAIKDLTQVIEECEVGKSAGDVVEIANRNLERMNRGEFPLEHYQVI